MKTLGYTLYVAVVLMISGLAKAQAIPLGSVKPQYQTSVRIDDIRATDESAELLIAGALPNPCYGDPSASLTVDSSNPSVLVLRLNSPVPMNMCIARIKYFTTSVDLNVLAKVSALPINAQTTYQIKAEGTDFLFEISGADLLK